MQKRRRVQAVRDHSTSANAKRAVTLAHIDGRFITLEFRKTRVRCALGSESWQSGVASVFDGSLRSFGVTAGS